MSQRVLVVEDEPSLLFTLVANLELEGFEVSCASNGEEALSVLREKPFDLVLTDIRMPGMSGVELYHGVRRLGLDVPVVLMTAYAVEGLVKDAILHGAFAVLPKPFDVAHLIDTVNTAARKPAVLVIDDEAPVADSTVHALDAAGVRARAVYGGVEALSALDGDGIDVCVVDMVMPGIAGPELCERIRRLDDAIALIAMSGQDVPGLFQKAAPHVYVFVRKPVDMEKLVQLIAQARSRALRRVV
jgi:DNA-binding NtrC family response regulator